MNVMKRKSIVALIIILALLSASSCQKHSSGPDEIVLDESQSSLTEKNLQRISGIHPEDPDKFSFAVIADSHTDYADLGDVLNDIDQKADVLFLIHTGDFTEAGDPLTDGPLVPHDILRIKGEEALQRYLITEIQNVYRSQNVNINDKHIEIICAAMMRKVEIESVGDSALLPGEVLDRFVFKKENEKLTSSLKVADIGDATELEIGKIVSKDELAAINERIGRIGGRPATGKRPKAATAKTLLLGITKASLWSDSWIAAASFQETTKVLTEGALASKVDELHGLKENVILGHLVPAGTAFKQYLETKVKRLVEAPLPKEFEEVSELREAKEAEAKAEAAVREALGIE